MNFVVSSRSFESRLVPFIPKDLPPRFVPLVTNGQMKTAWAYLDALDGSSPMPAVTIAQVQEVVCEYFNTSRALLISPLRASRCVYVRHIAMYLCHHLTSKSYPQIGRMFGDRDHSTILHAVRKMTSQRLTDDSLSNTLDHLTILLGGEKH
jgi:chromosomal replication initiation ATPase DnaA